MDEDIGTGLMLLGLLYIILVGLGVGIYLALQWLGQRF